MTDTQFKYANMHQKASVKRKSINLSAHIALIVVKRIPGAVDCIL